MKKILISLSIIGAVAAIAVGGTIAYFSDTETSTGNTFTAGTLDLTVDAPQDSIWTMTNMAPGDSTSGTLAMTNAGSLPGDLYATITFVEADKGDKGEGKTGLNKTAQEVADNIFVTSAQWVDNSNSAPGLNLLSIPGVDANSDGDVTLTEFQTAIGSGSRLLATLVSSENASLAMTTQFNPAATDDFQGEGVAMTITLNLHQAGH